VVYATQAGMTNYTWMVSAGGLVTAGGTATSNTVTITWNSAGAQTVSVNYANANGCVASTPTAFSVTVNPTPVPTIGSNNTPCVGSTGNLYYTEGAMTNYLWTVPAGGTIVSGQGTSYINVTWTGVGAQWVSVIYTNASLCTAMTPTIYNLFVNPMPNAAGAVTGTATLCAGTNGVAYSCAEILNATSYTWTLPAGAVIATGAGTRNVTVNFGATAVSGNITVAGTNSCGNGTPSPAFAVTVNPLPAPAGTISGPASVCAGATGIAYSVPAISGAVSYVWTVPAGATITSGGTTKNIVVSFGQAAGTGTITVLGVNTCGNGTVSANFNVSINAIPAAPVITVLGNVLTSSAPAGNQWYYEGTAIAGATGQAYTVVSHTGYYWCMVTTSGCASPISNKVWVVVTGQQEQQNSDFNIFPVPNDGRFTVSITSPSEETFTIAVYNQLGAKIYELGDVVVIGAFERQIDLRPVAPGIYTVVFFNNEHKVVKKVIVNK
jgi:PKD-like domain/Secretion system C-terminal sorting domain